MRTSSYNCSPVCGLSAQWLYDGASGNLLQEDLCHTPCLPSLLQSESLSPLQATADLCLHRRHYTQSRSGSGSVGSLCPGAPKVLFEPSEHLCEVWYYMWFYPPSYHLVGLLLCPSMWGVFFQHSPVNDCLSVNCNFGVLAEDECMFFYYTIVFVPHVTPYISVMKAVSRFKCQLSLNCL